MAFTLNNCFGAETNGLEEAIASTANVSTSSIALFGNSYFAYDFSAAGANDYLYFDPFESVSDAGGSYVVGARVQLDASFGSGVRLWDITSDRSTPTTPTINVRSTITTAGALTVVDANNSIQATSSNGVVAEGGVYYIEIVYTLNNTTGSCEIFVDGVSVVSATNIDTLGATQTNHEVRFTFSGTTYVDDIYFASGLASAADRLGSVVVRRYGSTNATSTPDLGISSSFPALNQGTWDQTQDVPFVNDATPAGYTGSGTLAGGLRLDDLGGNVPVNPTKKTGLQGGTLIQGTIAKPDGTKLYALDITNPDTIYQYDLSTAWDASTAANGGSKDIGTLLGDGGLDIAAKSDGSKFYVGYSGGVVYALDAGTNWDVSTLSYNSETVNLNTLSSGVVTSVIGLGFSADGTKLYAHYNSGVQRFTLSTAWDISTAAYDGTGEHINTTGVNGHRQGLAAKSDGTLIYLGSKAYELSTAWSLNGATKLGFSNTIVPGFDSGAGSTIYACMAPDGDHLVGVQDGNVHVAETAATWKWYEDGGPLNDDGFTGATVVGMKVIAKLERSGGSDATQHIRVGWQDDVEAANQWWSLSNNTRGETSVDLDITTSPAIYMLTASSALPDLTNHLAIGAYKGTGGQDLLIQELFGQVLVQPSNDVTMEASPGSFALTGVNADLTAARKLLAEQPTSTVEYYADASVSGPTDTSTAWTDDANAFDGNDSTFAECLTFGNLLGTGVSGAVTASPVEVRYSTRAATEVQFTDFITTNFKVGIDIVGSPQHSGTIGNKTGTLTDPTGGWTQSKLENIEIQWVPTNSAGWKRAYRANLSVDYEGFVLTGVDADLIYAKSTQAETGSFALTGIDADLAFDAGAFQAEAGSFALTGNDADLDRTVLIEASPGSFALTGQDADLLTTVNFAAEVGAFNVNGQTSDLLRDLSFDAETTSYDVTGIAADLDRQYHVNAEVGSFTLTGIDANLALAEKVLPADPQTYALTGIDASLLRNLAVLADTQTFDLTGQVADLDRTLIHLAEAGSFDLTGIDAATLHEATILGDPQSYAATGIDASLEGNFLLEAATETFALTGIDANLTRQYTIAFETSAFNVVGQDAELDAARALSAETQAFTLTGQTADLDRGYYLALNAGSIVLAGQAADFVSPSTYEFEGYRFRNDDNDEANATWREAQDVAITETQGVNVRLRTLVDVAGNPGPAQVTLQYRKVGDPTWKTVQ